MPRPALLAAALLVVPAVSQAATIQTSLAAFQAAAGASMTTDTVGALFAPISSFTLANGISVTLAGTADAIDQPGVGILPFANGYIGQVVDSTSNRETLSFATPLRTFGLTLQPDVGLFGRTALAITVTLGDGTSTRLSGSYAAGDVQFIGFTGGPETSLTITTTGAPDFSFGQFLTSVPEPAAVTLLATTLLMLPIVRRRR